MYDNSDSSDDDYDHNQLVALQDSSDDDDDHNQLVVLQDNDVEEIEDEEQAAAAAAAAEDDELRKIRHCQIITVLEKKKGFSFRTRNKVDELIEEFLEKIKRDIHDMICDNQLKYRERENRYDDYRGLDSDRDTEEEVETTLRCFPELLSLRKYIGFYPIQYLAYTHDTNINRFICNVKAVSYIPLVARLSIEFGLFERERGGLLLDKLGVKVLGELVLTDMAVENQEHHELADDKYLLVMKKLRQMGLLKKEDIPGYRLLNILCMCENDVFAEKRFRFMVEWDPTALLLPEYAYDSIPLYNAASNSIQTFRIVFEYGIRYYPNKKGINLLFRKNRCSSTPFQLACKSYGRDEVMRVVEEILIRSSSSDNPTPLNVAEALIMAAIDANIHLDCVYFLFRRHPDVLIKLLSGSSSSCPTSVSASVSEGDVDGSKNNRDSSKKRKI